MITADDISCSVNAPTITLRPGETTTTRLSATVTNSTGDKRRVSLAGYFGDQTFDTKEIRLAPGQSESLTFSGEATAPQQEQSVDIGVAIDSQSVIEASTQPTKPPQPPEDGPSGGGGGGSGGGGGTPRPPETTLADLSVSGLSTNKDRVLEGNAVSVSATISNNGATPITAGLEASGGSSLTSIPPGESRSVSLSLGTVSGTGRKSVAVSLTDGDRSRSIGSVSFEVEPNFTQPDNGSGGGSGGSGGGGGGSDDDDDSGSGGGGGGGGGSRCGPDERYSSSIGECIPDCPQGQAFFPGLGCSDVSSNGYSPEAGMVSPEVADLHGGARRAIIYSGRKEKPLEQPESGRGRRSSGT